MESPFSGREWDCSIGSANRVMPPQNTWFEPKLRDGLFVHMFRDGKLNWGQGKMN